MAKNQTYKAFIARPSHVLDLNGELLDNMPIMSEFASEVQGISGYATFIVRNDIKLEAGLAQVGTVQPAVAGRWAGRYSFPLMAGTHQSRKRRKF